MMNMKFIVDKLPYYGDKCPFNFDYEDNRGYALCSYRKNIIKCPRYWDCSDDNPHECEYLIEFDKYMESRK